MARVLVVEDDPDLARVLAYLLGQQGHEVVLAADGAEAMARFRAEALDLVLLDLHLPRLNGFEVCRAIRAAGPTPILCLSGLADEQTVRRALDLGADDFLLKPFSFTQLMERIQALLGADPPV